MTEHEYKELKPKVRENKILMGSEKDIICDALEKQIPKKLFESECPNCGEWHVINCETGVPYNYCHTCGQRLDWSETE